MAQPRPLYIGPRLRRLRRELGLTQQAMGEDLTISPSYIALLERNQRPVTAELLLRLARTYKLDVADLAQDDGVDIARRVGKALRDPLFAGIDLPALEVADLAANFPGVSEALLRLHGAYLREQQALAEQRVPEDRTEVADPIAEVRRFLAAHGNHFPALDEAAEALSERIAEAGGPAAWLAARGVRVRFLPPDVLADTIRRFDRHSEQLLIDETLDAASRAFQLAVHIAYTALRPSMTEAIRASGLTDRGVTGLARRALAGYTAAALLMPYDRFARAAEGRRYDIEALGRQFGASFEQVAHRLTTLGRLGQEGVRFALVRVDSAGNVSKRLDGAGFPFAAHGGGCPLWSVHAVFRRPGEIVPQRLELPDGRRFLSVARTVRAGGGRFGRDPVMRAVALVCAAADAPRLIYDGAAPPEPTPIGVTCRLCQRAECVARAVPPIGREVIADDNRRGPEPFSFAQD
jgi:hypothetical protein